MGFVFEKKNEKFSVADEMDQLLPSFYRFLNLEYSPLHVSVERVRCWADVWKLLRNNKVLLLVVLVQVLAKYTSDLWELSQDL